MASRIGFSWPIFSAFATDWSQYVQAAHNPDDNITVAGIRATGWDIWNGGLASDVIPRAHGDAIEELLGKRGSITVLLF